MATVYGTTGNDRITTTTPWPRRTTNTTDKVYANRGNDTVLGGGGNDNLYGQSGNDRLYGQNDNDQLYGERGNDQLYGGSGNDILIGADWYDRFGIGEVDTLTGGSGSDQFYLGKYDRNYYKNFSLSNARDYALITDFQLGQDQIKVAGTKYGEDGPYRLGSSSFTGISGTAIYAETSPEVGSWDLIGVVKGVSPFNLKIEYGDIFTTIKGRELSIGLA